MNKTTIIFLIFCNLNLYSQKIVSVEKKFSISLEDYRKDVAEDMCGNMARKKAIEDTFGKEYNNANSLYLNTEGNSKYESISESFYKGIWIEDTKPQTNIIETINGIPHVSCKISGKIKELSKEYIYSDLSLLNCPRKTCSSNQIKNESNVYIYIKPPITGYIYIFLLDKEESFKVLPSESMINNLAGGFKVEGGKEYIFFEPKKNRNNYGDNHDLAVINANLHDGQDISHLISNIELFSTNPTELNKFEILFSKDKITPPVLGNSIYISDYKEWEKSNYKIPNSVSIEEYLKWKSNFIKSEGIYWSLPVVILK